MKKRIIIFSLIFLGVMFLIYAGFFRNPADPLSVSKFYLDCIKNREGFLLSSVYAEGYHSIDKGRDISLYGRFNLSSVEKIKLSLLEYNADRALVLGRFLYKDKAIIKVLVSLKKFAKNWLITDVKWGDDSWIALSVK
ncbi:MAG: hypothetical protein WC628_05910 [Candidatus Omnitrophota bacterium]